MSLLRQIVARLLPQREARQLSVLARAAWQQGDREGAVELARKLCRFAPDDAEASVLLGSFLIERAREVHNQAAAHRGNATEARDALYAEAIACLSRGALRAPANAHLLRSLAIAQREAGQVETAHATTQAAYAAAPGRADIAADLAFSLQCRGETAAATALFERILETHPEDANAHAALALSLLGAGEFARGWDEYEWRLRVPGSGLRRNFPFPPWQGEDLAARTLFVYSEQGIGDEVMFASCFRELQAAAGHCVLESSRRLSALFERSFPGATLLARDRSRTPDWTRLPRIDLQVAAGSVARILRRSLEDFAARTPYLVADSARVAHWRERLSQLGAGLKVGLVWTGGLPGTLRAARSLSLEALRPVVELPGAAFVSIEFLDCAPEVEAFNRRGGARVQWWPEAVKTIDETAALLDGLDLVLSVTTASAHIAGALGKPVWVMVPTLPTWRYMWRGERTPWYPTMRIFRGRGERPAEALVAEVREALAGRLRG